MVDDKELAAIIARQIFRCGDEPNYPAQRIQFIGGTYPHAERAQGGFAEKPLADFIEKVLNKHRSY